MFDMDKVSSVYSGRKGCACGCRGKYTYCTAEARPSYMTGDEGVNPKSARRMVDKVMRMVMDPNSNVESVSVDPDGEWFGVDMYNDRMYTVYFR